MVFSVDKRLKRKIQIATRKQVHGIYYLWLFEKDLFCIGYCLCNIISNLLYSNRVFSLDKYENWKA